jgi:hypothetical protein
MRCLAPVAFGLLALFALPETASAIQLSGELRPKGANCAFASAEVLRWSPAAGPLASFVTDAYLEKDSVYVAIGYDAQGFWSAQADPGGDGCDDCSQLFLRHTAFSGKVLSSHLVGEGSNLDQEPDATKRRNAIKQRIFTVAKGSLDLTALRHDYELSVPKHDADGAIEKFSGWFAQIKKKDGALLRFAIVSTPFMCWCDSSWKAYTLAQPAKNTSTSGRTK